MKKLMGALLTAMLALTLVACGNVNEGQVRVGSNEITLKEFKDIATNDTEKFATNYNTKHAILKGTISEVDTENKTITVGDFCIVSVGEEQANLAKGDKVSIIGKITSSEEGKVFFADKNKFNE